MSTVAEVREQIAGIVRLYDWEFDNDEEVASLADRILAAVAGLFAESDVLAIDEAMEDLDAYGEPPRPELEELRDTLAALRALAAKEGSNG